MISKNLGKLPFTPPVFLINALGMQRRSFLKRFHHSCSLTITLGPCVPFTKEKGYSKEKEVVARGEEEFKALTLSKEQSMFP